MATSRKRLLLTGFVIPLIAGRGQPEAEMNNVAVNEGQATTNAKNDSEAGAGNSSKSLPDWASNASLVADTPSSDPAPASTPNYALNEGNKYYYVSAVSEDDKKKGKAVGDVFIFRNLELVHGKQTLIQVEEDGTVDSIDMCTRPCAIIRDVDANGQNLRLIPYNEESIIGEAFADSFNGFLKRSTRSTPIPDSTSETRH